ncbi:MAG: hypothetical protein ACOC43_07120 [Desulfohalobiaceae bacterium]
MNKCPICASQTFYIQDPEEDFEFNLFEMTAAGPVFEERINPESVLYPEREVFCDRCSWHGRFIQLQQG